MCVVYPALRPTSQSTTAFPKLHRREARRCDDGDDRLTPEALQNIHKIKTRKFEEGRESEGEGEEERKRFLAPRRDRRDATSRGRSHSSMSHAFSLL